MLFDLIWLPRKFTSQAKNLYTRRLGPGFAPRTRVESPEVEFEPHGRLGPGLWPFGSPGAAFQSPGAAIWVPESGFGSSVRLGPGFWFLDTHDARIGFPNYTEFTKSSLSS